MAKIFSIGFVKIQAVIKRIGAKIRAQMLSDRIAKLQTVATGEISGAHIANEDIRYDAF